MGMIDAHVHVWTDDLDNYPLAEGFVRSGMKPPTFTAEELFARCRPVGVDRVVLIQMSFYGFDNTYMLDTIQRYPESLRGVAVVDHTRADLGAELERLRARGVRGLRVYQRTGDPLPTLADVSYAPLLGLAGELGLAVCPLIDPERIGAMEQAAEAFPGTLFVIDHLGRVGASGEIREADCAALLSPARLPNCLVKVSAFYALGAKRPPHDDLAPLIRKVRDAYGAERMLWATDCPYQVQSERYEDSVALIRDRLDFLTEAEVAQVLCGTSERLFFG